MQSRPKRQRKYTLQVANLESILQAEDLEKIIELLEKAHLRGDLDDPQIAEHVVRLKKIAAQLPAVAGDERLWLKLLKDAKVEIYEFSTTLLAKIVKEFS